MNSSCLNSVLFAVLLAVTAPPARAGTVVLLTSFPKELTDAYREAFERKNPDVKIDVLNKNTTAAIAYLRELPAGQRPDIFWVSNPTAFKLLSNEKLLVRVPEVRNAEVPQQVGGYPIDDPDGYFYGQALSGYGLMWNLRYAQAHRLPRPREWADLTAPAFHGHVAMSAPSLSGTTHMTVESMLQGLGWDEGWRQLLQIAGNCAAITDRSYSVPDGVSNGQYGVGLVIDFFGLASKAAGFPVEFVYPSTTAVVPASIGIVAGGRNPVDAKRFAAYTLSHEGQELLFVPKVSRLPVLPVGPSGLKAPAGYPDIYSIASRAKLPFDADLAEERYAVVASLFDHVITFRHKELQQAAGAIHEAQRRLALKHNAQAALLLKRAREYAFDPALTEAALKQGALADLFRKNKRDVSVARQLTQIEDGWSSRARENYLEAARLARLASEQLK